MQQKRPPIIAVLGHVDHGKTTLLDFIRKTDKAAKEAGGITQSIGAYEITHNDQKITFIDTPGHEAFKNMRASGAQIADLAILVVAVDDGVKPQTKEALECITQAKIPYVVAINKIDKDSTNLEKTKSELAQAGVFLEGRGGNISFQETSATTGQGINELLDLIALAAELEELTYDPETETQGIVLTSKLDPRRGVITGVLIKNGTLKKGQLLSTPSSKGKVKILENSLGESAESLEPSAPALIIGFSPLPKVGEEFTTGDSPTTRQEQGARPVRGRIRQAESAGSNGVNLVLKADGSGPLEALRNIASPLGQIVESNVGNITESDVQTAISTNSIVVGFNTKIDEAGANLAHARKIKIVTSDIIYELEKQIKEYLEKRAQKEVNIIDILALFGDRKGKEQVIGGKVTQGIIENKTEFEIWKDDKQIGTGKIINLQSQREDKEQVEEGSEMGALVETDEPIAVGHKLVFSN